MENGSRFNWVRPAFSSASRRKMTYCFSPTFNTSRDWNKSCIGNSFGDENFVVTIWFVTYTHTTYLRKIERSAFDILDSVVRFTTSGLWSIGLPIFPFHFPV